MWGSDSGAEGDRDMDVYIGAHSWLPVLGVSYQSKLQGLDSLLSTAQIPGGIPLGTLAIGEAGPKNGAPSPAPRLGPALEPVQPKVETDDREQSVPRPFAQHAMTTP